MQSDVFVGLYWQRYGWIGPDMDISGLEDEFRLSDGIPRLLYVKTPAPDREHRLTAMIEELQAEGTESYRSFRTPRELARLVQDDLALLLSERFAGAAAGARSRRSDAPGAGSDRRGPRTLPVPSTSLIGREDDIAEVVGLLEDPDTRLVTLTGPGGIGKTRLAVAVGDRLDGRSPQGTVFVPLAPITEPELVLSRIADGVGATMEGTRPALDVLAEHFGDSRTLLVLDNLEQVVAAATDLDQLLARCPELQLLATSRTVLRLRAEREYPVGALAVPAYDERPPVDELLSLPAVQLFLDRARAVRYDFALSEDDAWAVARICRRLDGLPLAIELAAARIRLLDPAALLERLEGRLDALGRGPVDLPERQRTLRATVEWSIGLLGPDEQEMLAALSVFVGGWTTEAAVEVAGLDEYLTLDLLDALAGHSLVRIEASDPGPRFSMLAAVRELAAERLAAGTEQEAVQRRHGRYYGALVENADWPAERHAEWAERLRIEEENLRIAIRWHLTNDIAPLPHMFRILWLFWQMYGRMPEGNAWIHELHPRAGAFDDRGRAELLFTSAVVAVEVGDDDGALAALDGLERLDGHLDDPYLVSAAKLAISWIRPLLDDFDGALRAATSALEGFRRQDEPFTAFAALTVGGVAMVLGQSESARAHLGEADALGQRFGNAWLMSSARSQLAALEVVAGRFDEARALLRSSVDARDHGDLAIVTLTFSLVATARLALAEGDGARAACALGAADGLRREAGVRAWPSTRRGEAELVGQVAQRMGAQDFGAAFRSGSGLGRRRAIALVRGEDR
jgi:predicted ATPase